MNKGGDENSRVRITKRAIQDAVITLLEKKPINKISVREVCELAQISRGTFYIHYSDVFDVVEKLENQIASEGTSALLEYQASNFSTLTAIYDTAIKTFSENKRIMLALVKSRGLTSLEHKLYDILYPRTERNLHELFGATDEEIAYMNSFVISSAFGMISQWLADGEKEDPKVLAAILSASTEAAKAEMAKQKRNK